MFTGQKRLYFPGDVWLLLALVLTPVPNTVTPIKPKELLTLSHSERANNELLTPSNWIAHGGCWTFSGSSIHAQAGPEGRHLLYFNKQIFRNFVFEVRLNKLAEGGPFGLIIRYDEKEKTGYTYLLFPGSGGYRLAIIKKEPDYSLFQEPATRMNKGTNVWNTIKIICKGPEFEMYMNNQYLTTVIDYIYSAGRVGFFVGGDPRQKAIFEIISLKEL